MTTQAVLDDAALQSSATAADATDGVTITQVRRFGMAWDCVVVAASGRRAFVEIDLIDDQGNARQQSDMTSLVSTFSPLVGKAKL